MKKEKLLSTSKLWLPRLLKFGLCPIGESDKVYGPSHPHFPKALVLIHIFI